MNENQKSITGHRQPATGNHKAILFDLDGTLLNSLQDLADSMNRVLAAMGYAGHPLAAYRYFVGDGVEMLVRRSLPREEVVEARVREGVDRMHEEYGHNWAIKTRPYDGIVEAIGRLRELGSTLAVLSNKPHAMTVKAVEHFFPDHPFAAVWGARPDIAKKPSPEAALLIARQLDILPRQFLYLGDTDTDMRTAKGAGMTAVGAAWGFRTVEELLGSGADTVLSQPWEMIHLYTASKR